MVKKPVSTSPEKPGTIQTVELLQRRWLTRNVFEIDLTRPPSFEFKPGQTIRFIHESLEKYYSLLSAPHESNLTLCVRHVPQGDFSPLLANAEIGCRFKLTGPHGYFTFKSSSRQPVFIATGTGIAPFVSFARSGITDFTLLHQALSAEDFYYQSYFQKLSAKCFSCLSVTPNKGSSFPNSYGGNISDCIRKNLPPGSYDFYLCGQRQMIREVTLLADEIYPESRVYTEVFF